MRDYINSPRGREAVLTRGASVCFVALLCCVDVEFRDSDRARDRARGRLEWGSMIR